MQAQVISIRIKIAIILLTFGYSLYASTIVGKWVGYAPDNVKISYQFDSNNSLIWTVDKPSGTFSTNAEYSIDYSAKPIRLDIYDFTYPQLKTFHFFGIVEFKDKGTMLLYGQPSDTTKQNATYPEEFAPDSIEFQRLK